MKRGAIHYGLVAMMFGVGFFIVAAGLFSLAAAIMYGWYWALLFPGCLFLLGVLTYVMESFE